MSPKIIYKRSVEKDFRKFLERKSQRQDLKARIESNLCKARYNGKKLKGEYKNLYSLNSTSLVVYETFKEKVLVLAVEPRENRYCENCM